jgi:hypothetical protein
MAPVAGQPQTHEAPSVFRIRSNPTSVCRYSRGRVDELEKCDDRKDYISRL